MIMAIKKNAKTAVPDPVMLSGEEARIFTLSLNYLMHDETIKNLFMGSLSPTDRRLVTTFLTRKPPAGLTPKPGIKKTAMKKPAAKKAAVKKPAAKKAAVKKTGRPAAKKMTAKKTGGTS